MKNYIFLFFIIGCLPLRAQIQFNSFDEVLTYADVQSFALKSAHIGEQIAIGSQKEAKFNLLPTVNAGLGYNDNITLQPTLVPAQMFNPAADEGAVQELTFGTKYQYTRSLQAQWDILNFQKLFNLQTAKLSVEGSKISTEMQRLQV